jgi:hypothetical protein
LSNINALRNLRKALLCEAAGRELYYVEKAAAAAFSTACFLSNGEPCGSGKIVKTGIDEYTGARYNVA